jgi:hypothetical protein
MKHLFLAAACMAVSQVPTYGQAFGVSPGAIIEDFAFAEPDLEYPGPGHFIVEVPEPRLFHRYRAWLGPKIGVCSIDGGGTFTSERAAEDIYKRLKDELDSSYGPVDNNDHLIYVNAVYREGLPADLALVQLMREDNQVRLRYWFVPIMSCVKDAADWPRLTSQGDSSLNADDQKPKTATASGLSAAPAPGGQQ